ncbi:MAG TPA: PAS domain S-box protein, partial [Anaeromyxobacteraceae bacterium]|nr:PAS domain S-box protein [Anaeromyxobacteraceae bacterium]
MKLDDADLAQVFLETVGALVVVLDREGGILRWNAACERATGYSREEMLGRPFWDLLVPEERDGVRGVFDRLLARNMPSRHENHWVGRNGTRRLISWSNAILSGEGEEVRAIVATGIDITERTRAEEALREQAKRLEALAEASRVFASGLDYRTTLDT